MVTGKTAAHSVQRFVLLLSPAYHLRHGETLKSYSSTVSKVTDFAEQNKNRLAKLVHQPDERCQAYAAASIWAARFM